MRENGLVVSGVQVAAQPQKGVLEYQALARTAGLHLEGGTDDPEYEERCWCTLRTLISGSLQIPKTR